MLTATDVEPIALAILATLIYSMVSSIWCFIRNARKRPFQKAQRQSDAWERRGPGKNPRGRDR